MLILLLVNHIYGILVPYSNQSLKIDLNKYTEYISMKCSSRAKNSIL
jgi:hypothetical protein